MLIIDGKTGEVDRLAFFKLPDELRAKNEHEVQMVALIKWGFKRVGTYVNEETNQQTGEAFVGTADMTLIDVMDRKVIERRTFEGQNPAGGLTRDGDFKSERPILAVVEYLRGLPRR
ncbi:MAG: hypothetical protein HYY57_03920 [Candidatus Omnitrophica bacterium]|nr:hypothetical protein [Candidatus Omnitrophota bacterium]